MHNTHVMRRERKSNTTHAIIMEFVMKRNIVFKERMARRTRGARRARTKTK